MTQTTQTGEQRSRAAKAILILLLICLGSGVGVGVVYRLTKGGIEERSQAEFHETLASVLGEAPEYSLVGDYPSGTRAQEKVYVNKAGSRILYAATGVARGYHGPVEVLVSVEAAAPNVPVGQDPVIHAMVILESHETLGLGETVKTAEAETSIWGKLAGAGKGSQAVRRPWFEEQFSGKRLSDLVVARHGDADNAAAVTSATPATEAAHANPDHSAAVTGATPAGGGAAEAAHGDSHNAAAVTSPSVTTEPAHTDSHNAAAVTSPSVATEPAHTGSHNAAAVTSPSMATESAPAAGHSGAARIAAVTGATVTSRAATEAARRAVARIISRTAEVYGK